MLFTGGQGVGKSDLLNYFGHQINVGVFGKSLAPESGGISVIDQVANKVVSGITLNVNPLMQVT